MQCRWRILRCTRSETLQILFKHTASKLAATIAVVTSRDARAGDVCIIVNKVENLLSDFCHVFFERPLFFPVFCVGVLHGLVSLQWCCMILHMSAENLLVCFPIHDIDKTVFLLVAILEAKQNSSLPRLVHHVQFVEI